MEEGIQGPPAQAAGMQADASHMDFSHLFEEEHPPEAPVTSDGPDTIMDVELVEDGPQAAEAAVPEPHDLDGLDDMGPLGGGHTVGSLDDLDDLSAGEAPPIPTYSPPPAAAPSETFMVPQESLEESAQGHHGLGEHDLSGLDQDSEKLSVDGTEFADVDSLLDGLDDEE
jgi:hypothetical protein